MNKRAVDKTWISARKENWISVSEATLLHGVARRTLYAWISDQSVRSERLCGVLHTLESDLLRALAKRNGELFRENGAAKNTADSYTRSWRRFGEWCDQRSLAALPAESDVIDSYIAHLKATGIKPSAVAASLSAIAARHRTEGLPAPITLETRNLRRQVKREAKAKKENSTRYEILGQSMGQHEILETFGVPRAEFLKRLRTMTPEQAAITPVEKTDNTRRIYAGIWRRFLEWCSRRSLVAFPTPERTLGSYITYLVNRKRKATTIQQILWAIFAKHRAAGISSPMFEGTNWVAILLSRYGKTRR